MRIIFILGADRCGKSTLCQKFIENGWKYRHFSAPKSSPYGEYRDFVMNELPAVDGVPGIIVDRFMYCEFPYSVHYGRKSDMTFGRMLGLEARIKQLDPDTKLIYCETDLDSNWRRIQEEGKSEFKTKDELARLRKEYERVLETTSIPVLRYDFTHGDTPEHMFKRICATGKART